MKMSAIILSVLAVLSFAPLDTAARISSNDPTKIDDTQAIEKEILRLEEIGRQKVLKGDNNWDDLIADGAYMIAFDGSIILYKKGLQLPSLPMKSFTMSEMIARVFGDVVVVTGLSAVESETPDKKAFSFQMRFLNVWRKTDGSWKIVVSERTGVKPAPK